MSSVFSTANRLVGGACLANIFLSICYSLVPGFILISSSDDELLLSGFIILPLLLATFAIMILINAGVGVASALTFTPAKIRYLVTLAATVAGTICFLFMMWFLISISFGIAASGMELESDSDIMSWAMLLIIFPNMISGALGTLFIQIMNPTSNHHQSTSRSAPPLPPESRRPRAPGGGIPQGWTIEQWEFYGNEWLQKNK